MEDLRQPVYIAVKSCGHWIACTADIPERREDVAEDVAEWIREGWAVYRVEASDIRTGKYETCECERP